MKYQNSIIRAFIFMALFVPSMSYADLVDCGFSTIDHMYVNGDRDDASIHSNRLLVVVAQPCNGQSLVYVENSSAAFNSFLSTALTAFSSGKEVRIYVNASKTNQIAFMEMKK